MDLFDEFRFALAYQAMHGFPRMPDQPQGGVSTNGENWTMALAPRDAARLRRAIELGARGSGWWTERDNNL